MPGQALLDTDILLEIMKGRDAELERQASAYLAAYPSFTISIITRYEVLRGLKVRSNERQAGIFEDWCRINIVLGLDDDIIVKAADIYSELRRMGQLISDADILIAATAIVHRLVMVTGNTQHFRRISGLSVENWRTANG